MAAAWLCIRVHMHPSARNRGSRGTGADSTCRPLHASGEVSPVLRLPEPLPDGQLEARGLPCPFLPARPPLPGGDVPQSRQPTLPGLSLQSLVAHRVPLKPYAAPVPRSQSLQDQPTRNLAAFPASHEPDPAVPTPTTTPSARGAVIRQNSDPTSEGPGPGPNPPAWVRPDTEAPPKVRALYRTRREVRSGKEKVEMGGEALFCLHSGGRAGGWAACPGTLSLLLGAREGADAARCWKPQNCWVGIPAS